MTTTAHSLVEASIDIRFSHNNTHCDDFRNPEYSSLVANFTISLTNNVFITRQRAVCPKSWHTFKRPQSHCMRRSFQKQCICHFQQLLISTQPTPKPDLRIRHVAVPRFRLLHSGPTDLVCLGPGCAKRSYFPCSRHRN